MKRERRKRGAGRGRTRRTCSPSSLMKMFDVPPCRAYVCIAFLSDATDGALRTHTGTHNRASATCKVTSDEGADYER